MAVIIDGKEIAAKVREELKERVDLRYYNGDMAEYLKENQITDVLVLYNISNFISDRNLYKLSGGRLG